MWESWRLTILWASITCCRDSFNFYLLTAPFTCNERTETYIKYGDYDGHFPRRFLSHNLKWCCVGNSYIALHGFIYFSIMLIWMFIPSLWGRHCLTGFCQETFVQDISDERIRIHKFLSIVQGQLYSTNIPYALVIFLFVKNWFVSETGLNGGIGSLYINVKLLRTYFGKPLIYT
jgi:hypothetical protein